MIQEIKDLLKINNITIIKELFTGSEGAGCYCKFSNTLCLDIYPDGTTVIVNHLPTGITQYDEWPYEDRLEMIEVLKNYKKDTGFIS